MSHDGRRSASGSFDAMKVPFWRPPPGFALALLRDRAEVLLVLTRAVAAKERVLVSRPAYGDPDGFSV